MLKLDSEIDIAGFFKWWGSQLSFLLPQKFLDALARGKSLIVVEVKATAIKLSYIHQQQETFLGEFEFNDLAKEELHGLIASHSQYSDAQIVLRVPEHLSVVQDVYLPAAAADNLHQVMSYELDRYTPFNKDQVYFDVVKIGPANNNALIHLVLILVRKTSLETMYEQCLSLGLQPFYADSAVHIDVPDKVNHQYNLLPKNLCQTVSKKPLLVMLGSMVLMLVLLTTLIFLPLKVLDDNLADLKKHVRKVEKVALEIEDSKKSIDYLYQATQAIIDKKNAAPSMIELINTVSEVLKDDTWVSNLRYFNKTLQLSGQSGSASNLIGSLEKIRLLSNTRFISPVTKDNRTGLERFKISTEVIQKISDANADTE
ncbi:MAG: pilus assembly protein PilM [Methyloprofundus sp.]|nr:pilus assembly protein PilM [Methyloprofundus sp.]